MSNEVMSAPRSISTSIEGGPTLQVSSTDRYSWVWSDKGSGAKADCTVWRPRTETGYFIIGDYAQASYKKETVGSSLVVRAVNDDPNHPLLMPPTGWVPVWFQEKEKGGDFEGSIWAPTPPDGYHALGHAASTSRTAAPNIAEFRCVRADLLGAATAGGIIWADHGAHTKNNCTLFSIPLVPNAFVGQASYTPSYQGPVFRLKEQS